MSLLQFKTFSQIVEYAKTYIGNNTNITDFTAGSNILTITEAWASFVEYLQLQVNLAFNSFYISEARGVDLDNRVVDFGMTRNFAQASRGVVTFLRNTPNPSTFVIPAGSLVGTQPDVFADTIDFTVDSPINFPSGAISVTGFVTCTFAGVIGNVASGKITNILTPLSGVDSITNLSAFTNGSSTETDEQLRKRVPIFLNGLQRSNRSAIESAVLAIPGMTFARLADNTPTLGNITVYISNENGILTDEQKSQALDAINNTKAFGITASVITPEVEFVQISMDAEIDTVNYASAAVIENIKIICANFVNTAVADELLRYDIILQISELQGVLNIKNVKINGVEQDLLISGFKVVRVLDYAADISVSVV